ncbi:hypothetical protein BC831DRAFT_419629 [Entophlyctis helioformis]|nr:hypothetical protein BC831DRAFT_419629 [Entophlyctis helioformis]
MLAAITLWYYALVASLAMNAVLAQPRVWLSCPPSFNMSLLRQGVTTGPCENVNVASLSSYAVKAGDRLKVGWPSGNRGGGFVRLSLTSANSITQAAFNQSVLKVTCFGYDARPGRYFAGSCNHPCNGRPGCLFQSAVNDTERYDTTITVPFNLANGDYIIQMAAFVSNSLSPIYSCSKITVSGGNPGLTCPRAPSIAVPPCVVSFAPGADKLVAQSQPGEFCYSPTGAGSIDDRIADRPVNADCDPRTSCDLSNNRQLCGLDITNILDPETSPRQICTTSTSTSTSTRTTTTTSTTTTTTTTSTTRTSRSESETETETTETREPTQTETETTETREPTETETTETREPTETETTETREPTETETETQEPTETETETQEPTETETETETSSPTPTSCPSTPYPRITPGSACEVDTASLTCSETGYAQCAWLRKPDGSVVGGWVVRRCPSGTACRLIKPGYPVCDYIGSCNA